MNPHEEHKLERLIHQTLRELPRRRAPGTLEARVMAEIERRAALPWWKQGFAHWPVAARGAFVLVAIGFVKLALMGGVWVMSGFDGLQLQQAFATQFGWMESGLAVVRAIGDFVSVTLRSIPALWLYGVLAIFAALYAALFGLGAAAYRALYTNQ